MTVLCDIDIEAIAKGGAIDPYHDSNLQPASYDVTLSDVYRVMSDANGLIATLSDVMVDPFNQSMLDEITERRVATDGQIIIKPRQFILTGTAERVSIPPYIVGRIEGRSSLGRLGLAVHITAGYLDPGFSGNVTLECCNLSPYIIKLRPGMRIAQISFHKLTKYARKPYSGRYQNAGEVEASKYGKNMIHEENRSMSIEIPQYVKPMVRGEEVKIIGSKPDGYTGLGHKNGDILIEYPDGERGCVQASDIVEGAE